MSVSLSGPPPFVAFRGSQLPAFRLVACACLWAPLPKHPCTASPGSCSSRSSPLASRRCPCLPHAPSPRRAARSPLDKMAVKRKFNLGVTLRKACVSAWGLGRPVVRYGSIPLLIWMAMNAEPKLPLGDVWTLGLL